MPELSIIIPVYNTEHYINECIESVINQRFMDFELILVDDGSTDSSYSICEEYSKKDNRIRLFSKENGGQSTARNFGIDKAKGKYLGFVDSDDWIHECMFSSLIEHAKKNNSDIVACNFYVMDRDGQFELFNKSSFNQEFNHNEAMLEIFENRILSFSPCNKIYAKKIFANMRFKEGIILEDKDISYKLVNQAENISYLGKAYYYYRYNEKSTLRSEFSLKRLDDFSVQKEMYEFYCENYRHIADRLYFDLIDIGSYLYSELSVHSNKDINLSEYKYLISFDKRVLRRLTYNKHISLSKKIKVFLGLCFPRLNIYLRKTKIRLRKIAYEVKG